MIGKLMIGALNGQEKRSTRLFVTLLLSMIFVTDLFIEFFLSEGSEMILIPYLFLFLILPVLFRLNKKNKTETIKYLIFWVFIITTSITEVILYWDNAAYKGGLLAEVFFILFSPIFKNKRYFWLVSSGIILKYFAVGLLLRTTFVIWPTIVNVIFALVAFIILNRFIAYIDALNESYTKQFETAVSSGTTIINHTIKNEITKIQYLNNKLKELNANRDVEQAAKLIESIQQSTHHMLSMSNRLKERTEEIVLHEGEHNLNAILCTVVDMVEPYFETYRVQCNPKLEYEATILCDQVQIQEVLVNLMMNAVEAMERNGGILSIRLSKVKKDVVIQIEDTGQGIPNEIRSRVFEPFFTTKKSPGNYGLGLSYCYNVIQKHEGSIAIHSEESVGTLVAIHIPHHRVVRFQKLDRNDIIS